MFDKIKWLCAFTKYITKFYNKAPIHVNELILTAFSPFEIKCKIIKTSGIVFLGHLLDNVCVFGRRILDTF